MAFQKFEDLQSITTLPRKAANVCLYLGDDIQGNTHLPDFVGEGNNSARLGFVDWNVGYPAIRARLVPVQPFISPKRLLGGKSGKIEDEMETFKLCPELSASFISQKIADDFHLPINRGIQQTFPLPQVSLFSRSPYPVSSGQTAWANILVECSFAIKPLPLRGTDTFQFVVLPSPFFPDDTAIFGRDVFRVMLLLYRGLFPKNKIKTAPEVGRVYFGNDTGE